MTIKEAEKELIDEFDGIDDWMDRYALIIDMGNALPQMAENLKTPDRLIDGCQSRVWIDAQSLPDGSVKLQADSDAIIVRGIIAMLVRVLDGHKPQEILDADLEFVKELGLQEHLSPTRSNGLLAMIKQLKAYALALKTIEDEKHT